MKTSDFDYYLPPELIAQTPVEPRDSSRLMVLDRSDGSIAHRRFFEITDCLRAGDVLLFNDSRVIPARLKGRKADSGGQVEILLLRRLDTRVWEALVKPGRRARSGTTIELSDLVAVGGGPGARVLARVESTGLGGVRVVSFSDEASLLKLGEIPLPPYIHTPLPNPERYQTVYADEAGSVAAPTAGLHFTPQLLGDISRQRISCLFVTLHIGLDTFRPVREEDPLEHPIYQEYGVVSPEVASELCRARAERRRIICVGTTAVRLIEQVAQKSKSAFIEPFGGEVGLFILPGYRFRVADALITNFHLPRSTLMMLVTAFAGRDAINRAYAEAINQRYRFYSFGDAMLIL